MQLLILNNDFIVIKGNSSYLITLETVLAGHEGWVYGVRWSAIEGRSLQLVTASIDKTIILWEQPSSADSDDLWLEKLRLGEVGGNTLGFLVSMNLTCNSNFSICKYLSLV